MTKKERENAIALFQSVRGHYIVGQALYIAIKELEKVKEPFKENSNISDMKILMENIFPIYNIIQFNQKIK